MLLDGVLEVQGLGLDLQGATSSYIYVCSRVSRMRFFDLSGPATWSPRGSHDDKLLTSGMSGVVG